MNFFMALDGDNVLLRRQGFYKCYGNLLSKFHKLISPKWKWLVADI